MKIWRGEIEQTHTNYMYYKYKILFQLLFLSSKQQYNTVSNEYRMLMRLMGQHLNMSFNYVVPFFFQITRIIDPMSCWAPFLFGVAGSLKI